MKINIIATKIKATLTLLIIISLLIPTTIIPKTTAEPNNQLQPTPQIPSFQLKENDQQTINTIFSQQTNNPDEPRATLHYTSEQAISVGICNINQPVEQIILTQAIAGEHGADCDGGVDVEVTDYAYGTLQTITSLTPHGGSASGSSQGDYVGSTYSSSCFPSEAHGQTCADFYITAEPEAITIAANMYHSEYYAHSTANQPPSCGCLCNMGWTYAQVRSGFYVDPNTRVPLRMMIPFSVPQDGYIWLDPDSFIKNDFRDGSGSITTNIYLFPQDECMDLCAQCDISSGRKEYLWEATLTSDDGNKVLKPGLNWNDGIDGSGTNTRYIFVHRNESQYSGKYTLVVLFDPSVDIFTSANCQEDQQMRCDGWQQLSITIHYAPLDLDIDSDNTNTDPDYPPDRDVVEENLEINTLVGKYILPNDDDDNQNNIVDRYEWDNPYEDDFVRIVFEVPDLVSVVRNQSNASTVQIGFSYPTSSICLWKKNGNQPRTQNDILLPASYRFYRVDELDLHGTTIWLWVENIAPYYGSSLVSPEVIVAGIIPYENDLFSELFHGYDSVRFIRLPSIYVDLDVDSDNDNSFYPPERDAHEEMLEREGTGKIIWIHHEPIPPQAHVPPYSNFDLFPVHRSLGPQGILSNSNSFYHDAIVILSKSGGSGEVTIYAPPRDDVAHGYWQQVPFDCPLQNEYFLDEGGLQRQWYIVGEAPGEVILQLQVQKESVIITDTVKLTVVKITSVEWKNNRLNTLDGNPNAGGGLRIFPDRDSPNGFYNPLKRTIGVEVTIEPPLPNITVYLKYFDVDDPSDSRIPVDDESKNRDNRALGGFLNYFYDFSNIPKSNKIQPVDVGYGEDMGTLQSKHRATNRTGKVLLDFVVSMQPGDNYRVVADLAEYYWINTLRVPQSTTNGMVLLRWGNNVPSNHITPLLTVWRRLWIERDVMSSWSDLNQVSVPGTIVNITPNYGRTGYSLLTIKVGNCTYPIETDCFEGGYLIINNTGNTEHQFPMYPILKNWFEFTGNPPHPIYPISSPFHVRSLSDTMKIVIRGILPATAINSTVRIYDDDNLDLLPQIPNGGSTLINAFAQAYVVPIYWDEWLDFVPFRMHISADSGIGDWNEQKDSHPKHDLWTVFIVSAWEHSTSEDGDPDFFIELQDLGFFYGGSCPVEPPNGESPTLGAVQTRWYYSWLNIQDGAIFYQAIWDYMLCTGPGNLSNFYHIAEHIITHEIGHFFFSEHEPITIMDASPSVVITQHFFGPIFLDRIRSTEIP